MAKPSNDRKLDKVDAAIISHLQKDGRAPLTDVARRLGMATATVHQRYEKLRERGVIRGTRLHVDTEAMGLELTVLVGVHLNRAQDLSTVLSYVHKLPEVLEAHYTSGTYALFLKVLARDMRGYYEFLSQRLQTIPGIRSTESFMCMSTPIDRPPQIR